MKKTGIALIAIGLVLFIAWSMFRIVADIQFDRKCGGYLKRASDANTVEIAKKELQRAISYAEKEELTQGYTNILWQTPKEDIGFWYGNIKASLAELDQIGPDATKLERTNVLMKLRETLLDQAEAGLKVTVPPGISVFPYNVAFCFWAWLSTIVGVIGVGMLVGSDDF